MKLLFLIHNQDSRVWDELLKNLTQTSTLQECLGWVKCVESTVKTEALREKLLKGMCLSDSKAKAKVDMIRSKFKWKNLSEKQRQLNLIVIQIVMRSLKVVHNVVLNTHPANALLMVRFASSVVGRNTF